MSADIYITSPTYSSLLDMLKVYLNRRDVATVDAMPFFINSAEKIILRGLRIPAIERIVTFTGDMISEDGWVDLPSDLIELRHVWLNGDRKGTLERVPLDRLLRGNPSIEGTEYYNGDGGNMSTNDTYYNAESDFNVGYFAVTGTRMYLKGINEDEQVILTYYYDVPEIGPDTESNILLTLAPDAFLYLAVAEGWKFLMEPDKSNFWEQQGYNRLEAIQKQADEAEWAGSPLTIGPA